MRGVEACADIHGKPFFQRARLPDEAADDGRANHHIHLGIERRFLPYRALLGLW